MFRRDGMTLVEVLVAIFVMGIGLLSILAMFPLGARNMAQAIKDDYAGHAGANARAIATAQNLRFDPIVLAALKNPNSALYNDAPLDGPSHPVYIDPVGSFSYAIGADQKWVAANTTSGIPRIRPTFVANYSGMLKW